VTSNSWTVSPSPFIRFRPTVSRTSVVIIMTLLPQVLLLALGKNWPAVANVALATSGAVLAELCRGKKGRAALGDGTVIVTGILVGLLLPDGFNPILVPVVAFLGVAFARVIFGGTGSYWIHPAAVAVAIAWISRPEAFPVPLVTPEGMNTVGEAFGAFKLDNFRAAPFDQTVTQGLNGILALATKIRVPEGYATLFVDSPSAIPAFRFNALILGASIILIALDAIDWVLPAAYLATYAVGLRFFSFGFPLGQGVPAGDILFGFLTGGALFTAFYLLPDYATSPRTRVGKALTGVCAGIAGVALCGPGGSPVGSVFSVLLANVVSPVIEFAENRLPLSQGGRA